MDSEHNRPVLRASKEAVLKKKLPMWPYRHNIGFGAQSGRNRFAG
jgi:hypothetical protein